MELNQDKTVDLASNVVTLCVAAQEAYGLTIVALLIALPPVRSQILDYALGQDPQSAWALFDFLLEQERLALMGAHKQPDGEVVKA
ncbi:MAG: hypothetical protein VW405_00615 [Rhodospirillaceae bacterium]